LASFLQSPTTLKVSNLLATILAGGLFVVVFAGLPWIRQQQRPAAVAPSPAELARDAALRAESRALMTAKEWGMAAAATRQLLDRQPDDPALLLQLAEALRGQNRDEEEATTWERYLLVSPTPWFACPHVGRAYARAGNEARALDALERCYRIAPQNSDVIFFLAREYEKSKRWREARSLYEKGLELSPGYVDLRLGLGRMLLVGEELARAEAIALDVIAAQPANTDALLLLGSARRELGMTVEARAALQAGIALAPRDSDFHFLLGRVAEDEGKRDEAIRWYREALAIAPGRGDAAGRLAALETGGA
jgi:tetratricopeptide (TPR) repeat protein